MPTATPDPAALPAPIPRCGQWRTENPEPDGNPARYCCSVYCERCQALRHQDDVPALVPFTAPPGDHLARMENQR